MQRLVLSTDKLFSKLNVSSKMDNDQPVEKISAATAKKASETIFSEAIVMLSCRATLRYTLGRRYSSSSPRRQRDKCVIFPWLKLLLGRKGRESYRIKSLIWNINLTPAIFHTIVILSYKQMMKFSVN